MHNKRHDLNFFQVDFFFSPWCVCGGVHTARDECQPGGDTLDTVLASENSTDLAAQLGC